MINEDPSYCGDYFRMKRLQTAVFFMAAKYSFNTER